MAQTATTPYLAGNAGPVHEEVTAFDLPVRGSLPRELTGSLLRNGPNPIGEPDPTTYHWFTGEGMVHGLRLEGGRASWYRNRWVRSPDVAQALGEAVPPSPFPPDHRLFAANTNVIRHAGRHLAIVEAGSPPIELTAELDTIGPCDLDGTLEGPFSAHPHLHPTTGELHVAAYWWQWGNRIRYLIVGTDGRVRRNVDVDVPGGPMVHDIGLTDSRVVLFDLPCLFDLEVAMGGATLPYRWNPDYQARLGVLAHDGDAGDVQWFDIDPCYVFHPSNAYDGPGGTLVLDAVRHPRMFATDLLGPNEGPTTLVRWELDPATGKATETVIAEVCVELPRINETLTGQPYRFTYATAFDITPESPGFGPTFKVDVSTGGVERFDHGPGRSGMEPVFVPRDGSTAEDDGWLLVVVYDAARDTSDLVVLPADDLASGPVATVELPQRVPYGFHGNWLPDD